jgi:Cof subfamily protein (haloacid dehalogenase superfamily)
MIKLIVSDLDGTLIRKGMIHISPRVHELIHRMQKHGILFCAASGRPFNGLQLEFAPEKDEIAYISESGSIGGYNGELFYDHPLDRETVVNLVKDIRAKEGRDILYSRFDSTYIETEPGSRFYKYMIDELCYPARLVPDLLELSGSCYKVASCNFNGFAEDLDFYRERYGKDNTVVASGPVWVDIIPKDINKGTCLQVLLNKLGIAPDEILVFGDQENDLGMLELAEHAYAMEDSMEHVKKAAGQWTDCPEDVIEAYLNTLD